MSQSQSLSDLRPVMADKGARLVRWVMWGAGLHHFRLSCSEAMWGMPDARFSRAAWLRQARLQSREVS